MQILHIFYLFCIFFRYTLYRLLDIQNMNMNNITTSMLKNQQYSTCIESCNECAMACEACCTECMTCQIPK